MGGSVESGDGDVGFQIAPMVDVVFVIMLFFMASAGMQVVETELGLSLPSGAGAPSSTVNAPKAIIIQADGNVVVDDRIYDSPGDKRLPELKARLEDLVARFPDTPFIISPEPSTVQERVIDVMNAAAAAGVKNLTFR
ncbi:MAG: biopolymer transporter ExbD [Verrucomicrobiia bacterium]